MPQPTRQGGALKAILINTPYIYNDIIFNPIDDSTGQADQSDFNKPI
jgi:hypothetical protein